jgi:hypothetical protein
MKKIINISRWTMLLGIFLLIAASCNKNEDLVTANANTGGLVVPVTSNVAYKLANTPQVEVTIDIPVGPAITSLRVYNSFFSSIDGVTSPEVMMKEVPVTGSQVVFTVNYADLKNGILINGNPLPDDETLLSIGSSWVLVYHSVLADGREVVNSSQATTTIGVANIYAGLYHVTGTFIHPTAGPRAIDEDKYLVAISAYSVTSTTGDLGPDYPTIITVNPTDNSCVVTSGDGNPYDCQMTVGTPSYFDPATGKFYLYYFYLGTNGLPRIIEEEYTPIP